MIQIDKAHWVNRQNIISIYLNVANGRTLSLYMADGSEYVASGLWVGHIMSKLEIGQ